MFKVFKIIVFFVLLSFFNQKSVANTTVVFYSYESYSDIKQSTVVENDVDFQSLGLPNEINYRLSSSNLKVDFSSVQKKLLLKSLSSSLFKREQNFTNKIKLLWLFCSTNDISFTTFKIIFPFHYFW